MTGSNLLQLGLALGLLLTIVVLWTGIKRRRHREHLHRLCHKFSLGVLESNVRPQAIALASLSEGDVHKVRLHDILVGFDDDGRFYLGERRIGRRRHQVLFFESPAGPRLSGFRFGPEPRGRRAASRNESDAARPYVLRWKAFPSHWTEESVLSLGARVLYHAAKVLERAEESDLILEVDAHRVLVHSEGRLRGDQLARFFADATRMRRLLLDSQRRAEAVSGGVAMAS